MSRDIATELALVAGLGGGGAPGTRPGERGGRDEPETDGRRLRRIQNRDKVVDALLDLYRAGNLRPSTDEIAHRAGLSPRSLFRYFEDVDDLTRVAVARQQALAIPLLPIAAGPGDPLDARIDALVDQRFRLFAALGQIAKVSRLRAPFHDLVARELDQARAFFRLQVHDLFAAELRAMDDVRSAATLAAADVLTSTEARLLWLEDQRLDEEDARRAMATGLRGLFGAGPAS